MKKQRAQNERQELCEARIQKWQEEFGQMQLRQHQQVLTEHCELLQAQTKEQLSQHEHLVQRLGQLERRQGEEEQQLLRRQAELKENIAGLQERMDLAQSEKEQQFTNLREEVFVVDTCTKRDVGMVQEELQIKHKELGQAHEELKTEVAELGRRLAAKESTLRVAAPEFTPARSTTISSDSSCRGTSTTSSCAQQCPPPYDGQSPWDVYCTQFEMLATVNGWSVQEKVTYLAVSLKGTAVNVLNGISPDQLYD